MSTDELRQILYYFPIKPIDVVETRGIGVGYILKYNKFYLKLYKDRDGKSYSLFLYRYSRNEVITSFDVPCNNLKCIEKIFWEFEPFVICGY